MIDDAQLLKDFADSRREGPFSQLVNRHLDLVYATALRVLNGDRHLAEDVSQQVFASLARQASVLTRHPCLPAWLHRSARNAAIDLIKAEQRRRLRETLAAGSPASATPHHASDELSPEEQAELSRQLDALIDQLPDKDREALVLRHLKDHSFADIAVAQQITTDAARMRVNRALERLRLMLAKRGIHSSLTALPALLSAQSATQAPAALAAKVIGHCITLPLASSSLGLLGLLLSLKGSGLLLLSLSILGLGTLGLVLHRQAASLTETNQASATHEETRTPQASPAIAAQPLGSFQFPALQANHSGPGAALAASPRLKTLAVTFSEEEVKAALQEAKRLYSVRNYKDSLSLFLWCLDIGLPRYPNLKALRNQVLELDLPSLLIFFPEARPQIQERRDRFEATMDKGSLVDFSTLRSLNKRLQEQERTLRFLDSLGKQSREFKYFVSLAKSDLAEAGRYQDVLDCIPPKEILSSFERQKRLLQREALSPEVQTQVLPKRMASTLLDLEVLIGGKREDFARVLTDGLLALGDSPTLREAIEAARQKAETRGKPRS